MNKIEKQILKIILIEFNIFAIDEDIFDVEVEYFDGGKEYENQNSLEITKDYINIKICLDSIDLYTRFVEIYYDKKNKKVYNAMHVMKRYKTSFKKIMENFNYD